MDEIRFMKIIILNLNITNFGVKNHAMEKYLFTVKGQLLTVTNLWAMGWCMEHANWKFVHGYTLSSWPT